MQEIQKLKNEFSQKLEDSIDKLSITDKDREISKEILLEVLPKLDTLEERSQTFLINAEYFKRSIGKLKDKDLDYSVVVLQYGRAIENELVQINCRVSELTI